MPQSWPSWSAPACSNASALLWSLRALPAPSDTLVAVGPLAAGISEAPWSLSEARLTLQLAGALGQPHTGTQGPHGPVIDCEAFAVERLATILAQQFPTAQIWPSRDERDPLAWL